MEEQLISATTAKLANKKGFNIQTSKCIAKSTHRKDGYLTDMWYDAVSTEDFIAFQPTQSLLQKWLRDKHNVLVNSVPMYDAKGNLYFNVTFSKYNKQKIGRPIVYTISDFNGGIFNTYEEALEKGLEQGLKLINQTSTTGHKN